MTYAEQIREADSAFEVNHYLRAVDSYKKAYQLKKSIYPLQRLAVCYQENKMYEQAQSFYQMALELDANDPLIRFRYAVFYAKYMNSNKLKSILPTFWKNIPMALHTSRSWANCTKCTNKNGMTKNERYLQCSRKH